MTAGEGTMSTSDELVRLERMTAGECRMAGEGGVSVSVRWCMCTIDSYKMIVMK